MPPQSQGHISIEKRDEKLWFIMTFVLLLQVALTSIVILRLNALDQAINKALPFVKVAAKPPLPETEIVQDVSADDDPALGPDDAPITIIEFGDFQCGACRQADQALKQVIDKYTDEVRLVYRDFLLLPDSPSNLAAQAAQCAHQQDKFWEMHDILLANQEAITMDSLLGFADALGLYTQRFKTCLESAEYSEEIDNDIADGQRYGITAVPTFFVNGRKYKGALTFDQWQLIIDELLAMPQ
jgi:protein-disulfide isomerase